MTCLSHRKKSQGRPSTSLLSELLSFSLCIGLQSLFSLLSSFLSRTIRRSLALCILSLFLYCLATTSVTIPTITTTSATRTTITTTLTRAASLLVTKVEWKE